MLAYTYIFFGYGSIAAAVELSGYMKYEIIASAILIDEVWRIVSRFVGKKLHQEDLNKGLHQRGRAQRSGLRDESWLNLKTRHPTRLERDVEKGGGGQKRYWKKQKQLQHSFDLP